MKAHIIGIPTKQTELDSVNY